MHMESERSVPLPRRIPVDMAAASGTFRLHPHHSAECLPSSAEDRTTPLSCHLENKWHVMNIEEYCGAGNVSNSKLMCSTRKSSIIGDMSFTSMYSYSILFIESKTFSHL